MKWEPRLEINYEPCNTCALKPFEPEKMLKFTTLKHYAVELPEPRLNG